MQDVVPPSAPPPPIFTTPGIVTRHHNYEQGEADMDVVLPHGKALLLLIFTTYTTTNLHTHR